MTLENKKKLVQLLHLYMADIMKRDTDAERKRYLVLNVGIKSQFDHARIIANKLEREISTDLFVN